MRIQNKICTRRLLALAVIIAIGFRSLIPAGFMPDFSSHNHNPLALTICDGIHHHSPDGKNDRTDICAFSIGAIYGFGGIHIPAIIPPVYILALGTQDWWVVLKPISAFSNASPRSPPAFS